MLTAPSHLHSHTVTHILSKQQNIFKCMCGHGHIVTQIHNHDIWMAKQ